MNRKSVDKLLKDLSESIEGANKILERVGSKEYAAKWDRKYINDLPNAAFAVIESGYKEGGNKNARFLPHHSKNVKSAAENSSVDLSHYQLFR
jgi:hypothetical protein